MLGGPGVASKRVLAVSRKWHPPGQPRALRGFAISAKRYALYERDGDAVRMIDPKAHGLGYLYPPKDALAEHDTPPYMWAQPSWTLDAWEWIIRQDLT